LDRKQRVQEMFAARGSHTWSRLYENPASVFEDSMGQRREYVIDYVRRNLAQGSRILDLGCGAGVIAEDLARAGMNVTAMDLSSDMVARARDRLRDTAADVLVLRGDCEKLPFGDGEFDAIVCLGVISFLKSNQPVLSEIRRVLRDDGTLVLAVRNKHPLPRFLDPLLAARQWAGAILRRLGLRRGAGESDELPRFFHLSRLAAVLQDDGFRLGEKKLLGYGPFTVYGREVLSPARSIRLSRWLARVLALPVLRSLQAFADVCVFVFTKRPLRAADNVQS
jgi:2-polyprenyl-3-methyl-5-hydroxy-6-metoxy-1,4-benzoquinol methylase